MPQINPSWFQIDPWFIALAVICIIAFIAISVIWGIRAHRRQISAGREELVGKTAEVKVALKPKGTVFIEGEQWTAISETGRVSPGEEVIISKVDGLKLYVTKKQ
ncbi:NfeD family protein [Chloroflexota bacterium]